MPKERKKRVNLYVPHTAEFKVEEMTDEEAGKLLKALLAYSIHGSDTTFDDRFMRSAFNELKSAEKENAEAYKEECERRSEAAKEREEEKRRLKELETAQQPQQTTTTTSVDAVPQEPQQTTTTTDRIGKDRIGKDIYNITGDARAREDKPPEWEDKALKGLTDENVKAEIRKWLKYKRERIECPTPMQVEAIVELMNENIKKFGSQAVVKRLKEDRSSGYRGIVWDKLERNKAAPKKSGSTMAQREFDEKAEKERRIRAMFAEGAKIDGKDGG